MLFQRENKMPETTEGLLLYSRFTDNPIGKAIVEPAKVAQTTANYIEYAQFVTYEIDSTEERRIVYTRWRKPVEGKCWWQFNRIINNGTGLVTVEFLHLNSGLSPAINSVHLAKIGGAIANGTLQASANSLNVTVTATTNPKGYQLSVNSGQFTFQVSPDAMSPENANEVDFSTE
jgi:hypothetical protein